MALTKERILEILRSYISNDLAAAEPDYVREVITDICGCTAEEIAELGFDWMFGGGDDVAK